MRLGRMEKSLDTPPPPVYCYLEISFVFNKFDKVVENSSLHIVVRMSEIVFLILVWPFSYQLRLTILELVTSLSTHIHYKLLTQK